MVGEEWQGIERNLTMPAIMNTKSRRSWNPNLQSRDTFLILFHILQINNYTLDRHLDYVLHSTIKL